MIFGNRNDVALELHCNSNDFCSISLWLCQKRFGDVDETGLAAALRENLANFRQQEPLRIDNVLFHLPRHTVMSQVLDTLFRTDDRDVQRLAQLNRKYGPFLLSPNLCESLDSVSIVVVSDGALQRVICVPDSSEESFEARVAAGAIESILKDVERSLDKH